MFDDARRVLLELLQNPAAAGQVSLEQWNDVLPLARSADVWPQLATGIAQSGDLSELPAKLLPHVRSGLRAAEASRRGILWELDRIGYALRGLQIPLVLLKGAAYVAADYRCGHGRVCSDVDLLVPRDALSEVERRLLAHGWNWGEIGSHDERYYREWLQELPPLIHEDRETVLDVHHNLLPRIDRSAARLDAQRLLANASRVGETPFSVLSPVDLVLHSAIHLFRIGDFRHALRDLYDMSWLLRQFGADLAFWPEFVARAEQLRLTRPCYYALHYVERLFGIATPQSLASAMQSWRPSRFRRSIMERLMRAALLPARPERAPLSRKLAISALSIGPAPRIQVLLSPLYWIKRVSKSKRPDRELPDAELPTLRPDQNAETSASRVHALAPTQ